jgi:outer membrane murein-binding lipoprotein Lpp
MTAPSANEAPWSFFEWAATAFSTFALSGVAFVWHLLARIDRLETSVDQQRIDFDAANKTNESGATRLAERLEHLLTDHYRLRETIGALPTRDDLRDVEDHINERIESIVTRLDRALEIRGI